MAGAGAVGCNQRCSCPHCLWPGAPLGGCQAAEACKGRSRPSTGPGPVSGGRAALRLPGQEAVRGQGQDSTRSHPGGDFQGTPGSLAVKSSTGNSERKTHISTLAPAHADPHIKWVLGCRDLVSWVAQFAPSAGKRGLEHPWGLPQFCNVGRDTPLVAVQGAERCHQRNRHSSAEKSSGPNTSFSTLFFHSLPFKRSPEGQPYQRQVGCSLT